MQKVNDDIWGTESLIYTAIKTFLYAYTRLTLPPTPCVRLSSLV